jgi:hypothetical protein
MPLIVYSMIGGGSWLGAGPAFGGAKRAKLLEATTMTSQALLPRALCRSQDLGRKANWLTPAFSCSRIEASPL